MPIKTPKSRSDRMKECIVILRKLVTELDVPAENPSVKLLTKRMSDYWLAEEPHCVEERIPLVHSDRYILYRLPRWAHQIVEVTLRKGLIQHTALTADQQKELDGMDDKIMERVVTPATIAAATAQMNVVTPTLQ